MDNHCCLDYDKELCPQSCEYAEETKQYRELEAKDRVDKTSFWNHWFGSSRCKRSENDG